MRVVQLEILSLLCVLVLATCLASNKPDCPHVEKPTLYEYFTGDNITSGLEATDQGTFKLNGKEIKILGGSLHYFRVHPLYWRDRLAKFRAAGLNTVDV